MAFRNCAFVNARDPAANVFVFGAVPESFEFDGCMVRTGESATHMYEKIAVNATCGVVVGSAGYDLRSFSTRQTTHFDLNTGHSRGPREVNERAAGSRRTGVPIYAKRIVCEERDTTDPGFAFMSGGHLIDKNACASIAAAGRRLMVDTRGALRAADEWRFVQLGGEVGDVVVDQQTGFVFFVAARDGLRLTLVAQNGYDRDDNLLKPVTKALYFRAVNCRRYSPYFVTLGNLAAGEMTIRNVARPDGYSRYLKDENTGVLPLDYFYVGNGTVDRSVNPDGGQIVSVDDSSLTLSTPMNHSAQRKRLTLFIRRAPDNFS